MAICHIDEHLLAHQKKCYLYHNSKPDLAQGLFLIQFLKIKSFRAQTHNLDHTMVPPV